MKTILITIAIVFGGMLMQAQNFATDGFSSTLKPFEFTLPPVNNNHHHNNNSTKKKSDLNDIQYLKLEGHYYNNNSKGNIRNSLGTFSKRTYTVYVEAKKSFTGNWLIHMTHVDDEKFVEKKTITVSKNVWDISPFNQYSHYAEYKGGLVFLNL